jgi:membrane-associated phospholipid phosphatase
METTTTARGVWWRLGYAIGPDLIFLGLFLIVLAALIGCYRGASFTFVHGSFGLPLAVLGILLVAGTRSRAALLRDWCPLISIVFIYENFHDLTDLIHPRTVDAALRAWDERLVGVEPTLWLQAWTRPWLTEYMSFCYLLYFVYPTIILTLLYQRGEFMRFRELGLALSLAFYLGLLGYMLVPAIGPRYTIDFAVPLDGHWLTPRAAQAWDAIESIKRDCFPSLHTALTTVSLVYLWRLRHLWRGGRALLAVSAPLIVSLWVSTVYLRYHYLVDVLAGWALGLGCARAAPAIVRAYYARKPRHAPDAV